MEGSKGRAKCIFCQTFMGPRNVLLMQWYKVGPSSCHCGDGAWWIFKARMPTRCHRHPWSGAGLCPQGRVSRLPKGLCGSPHVCQDQGQPAGDADLVPADVLRDSVPLAGSKAGLGRHVQTLWTCNKAYDFMFLDDKFSNFGTYFPMWEVIIYLRCFVLQLCLPASTG